MKALKEIVVFICLFNKFVSHSFCPEAAKLVS